MPTIADIRAAGSELVAVSNPIPEPLNAPKKFRNRLRRFGDHYDTSNDSHLYRFLVGLCGDAGAGSLKKELLLPRLEDRLEATHFLNLDRIYGETLALPRISPEIYSTDPENQTLTNTQWNEIYAKDAAYRQRCLTWMRAIIEGPTTRGIALAAEAAIGVECDVFEHYRYLEAPTVYLNLAETSSRNEFVILPRTNTITEAERRRIMRLVDKLRPQHTISTVTEGSDVRSERQVREVDSTSDRFYVSRLVTGREDIDWPAIDLSKGYWIEAATEKEAPTFAFLDRQHAVTYLTVADVTSSSEHIGPFNKDQRALFAHLANTPSIDYFYNDDRSYAKNIAPVNLTIPWMHNHLGTTTTPPRDQVVVNLYYPLGYFAETDISAFIEQPNGSFWASTEKLAPAQEFLTFDFGRVRPFNFIDFQISQKPIDLKIEYDDNGTWREIQPRADQDVSMSIQYLPSMASPWHYFEVMLEKVVQTQYVRITFTRREQRFPLETTDLFPWSIELRNARLMHAVQTFDDFAVDEGVDVLGNSFRTTAIVYEPDNVKDDNTTTFWQSQPNPTRHAVEALYFDLRIGDQIGTMGYLGTQFMDELDGRSMTDMALYHTDGQVIDEIYVDPITYGPDMHFYYSLDDTSDWDDKLWVPIPRNYVCRKGFHALPLPTYVKYFKIEFSNLSASPYQAVEYPDFPPAEYRKYPTWVQDYFTQVYFFKPIEPNITEIVSTIQIDPTSFGFRRVKDAMVSTYEYEREEQIRETDPEVKTFIENVLAGQETNLRDEIESQVRFRSPVMWQADLVAQLDPTRSLSRVAQAPREGFIDTGWNAELGLPIFPTPVQQSVADLSEAVIEKQRPIMWFPRRCRHQYQIVRAVFDRKIAYFVAIREISFHRRAYTSVADDPVYIETLDDESHVLSTDFVSSDWRFVIEE